MREKERERSPKCYWISRSSRYLRPFQHYSHANFSRKIKDMQFLIVSIIQYEFKLVWRSVIFYAVFGTYLLSTCERSHNGAKIWIFIWISLELWRLLDGLEISPSCLFFLTFDNWTKGYFKRSLWRTKHTKKLWSIKAVSFSFCL